MGYDPRPSATVRGEVVSVPRMALVSGPLACTSTPSAGTSSAPDPGLPKFGNTVTPCTRLDDSPDVEVRAGSGSIVTVVTPTGSNGQLKTPAGGGLRWTVTGAPGLGHAPELITAPGGTEIWTLPSSMATQPAWATAPLATGD